MMNNSNRTKCELTIRDHVLDRLLERGFSPNELKQAILKGPIEKEYRIKKDITKAFIYYRYYIVVCVKTPCKNRITTIHYR